MKKWIITIALTLTLLALALATHFWGARVIKFAVDNDETVDSLKKLSELLIAIGGLAVPVIKWFWHSQRPPHDPGGDINKALGNLQTGGMSTQGNTSISGDAVGGDKKVSIRGDSVSGDKQVVSDGDLVGGDKVGGDKISGNKIVNLIPPPPPPLTPLHQLPSPPADFTGREAELRDLHSALEKSGVHISGLQGQGGVGKTALALKLSRRARPQLPRRPNLSRPQRRQRETPDRSRSPVPRPPRLPSRSEAPRKEDDLCALFRSVLHGKRVLLLMDNAKDAAQVHRLIPPEGCTLLVTSRTHFKLPGLYQKDLNTFPPADAKKLLLEIAPRIQGEADAIAKLCGYLALALRLAATAIAEHIDLSPAGYRQNLANEKQRLKLLAPTTEGGDPSVNASIMLSYNLLDNETKKRWRMLSVFPDTFDALAAVAVWEIETDSVADEAKATLSRLLQYSMLEWEEPTNRYRLHDLMRDFASQRLESNESDASATRHAQHYLAVLSKSDDLFQKGGDSIMLGLALYDLEVGNIQAGQTWAAAHAPEDGEAAQLCSGYPGWGTYVLSLRQHPREGIRWREAALTAARQLKDRAAEGRHLGNLGLAYADLGEYRRAIEYQEQRLAIARESGDRKGEGNALGNLGSAYYSLGDYRRAIEYYEQQLEITREIGDRRGEGNALGGLGIAYDSLGEYRRAIEYYEQQLEITREIGDRRGEGNALGGLGNAYDSLGEHRRAIEYYGQQLEITREIGDRQGEGIALWNTSLTLDKLGERKQAIELAEAALKIREQIEDPNAAKVRMLLDQWRSA